MMEADFWHQRWQQGHIGFHQDAPTPLLLKYWPEIAAPARCRVFVPLSGKSHDMLWLAAQGHRVLGVELSPLAVEQFFSENGLSPTITTSRYGQHYRAAYDNIDIELICGDAFALDHDVLSDCMAVFDRAALIALPAAMRTRYTTELYGRLPAGCRGMLITLEYPAHEKIGPPFSVPENEVHGHFGDAWQADLLERRDILAHQQSFINEGVTALHTCVYRLRHTTIAD